MTKVFIDGSAGTAGLRIHSRLSARADIELLTLNENHRKDTAYRKSALNSCDVAVLCLPDTASIEAVSMIENPSVRVVDTSTAHRTDPLWAYGFPELSSAHRQKIETSPRVSSPGCHAGGFVSLAYPLVEAGLLPDDALLSCHSLTGYSGGGKDMITQYEIGERPESFFSPRQYGLAQTHKHLIEMQKVSGLNNKPVFCPIVADYYNGMLVTIPLFGSQLKFGGINEIKAVFKDKYAGSVVKYIDTMDEAGFIASNTLSDNDSMEIGVFGNDERMILVSRFDNLGKGASGAALQCLNIMLGTEETEGLVL